MRRTRSELEAAGIRSEEPEWESRALDGEGEGGDRGGADLILDVPELSVDKLDIEVGRLSARLNIDARVVDLVQVRAGLDVEIEDVDLELDGVEAEAYLRIFLDRVADVLTSTLDTVRIRPELVTGKVLSHALGRSGEAVAEAGKRPVGIVQSLARTAGEAVDRARAGLAEALGLRVDEEA